MCLPLFHTLGTKQRHNRTAFTSQFRFIFLIKKKNHESFQNPPLGIILCQFNHSVVGRKLLLFLWRNNEKVQISLTFNFGNKAETFLEVGTDAVEAPAELGIAAVLVGAAGVVTHVQLVAALCHGRDSHVHLADGKNTIRTGKITLLGRLFNLTYPLWNRQTEQVRATSVRLWHLVARARNRSVPCGKHNIRYGSYCATFQQSRVLDADQRVLRPKGHVSFMYEPGLVQGP